MKSVKILGREISILVLVAILATLSASALLVTYLSNTINANVTVNSPIELQIGPMWNSLGNGPLNVGSISGGETIQLYISTENKANVSTTGTMWNVVSNPAGVTCADFAVLSAEVLHTDGNPWYPSSPIGCTTIDSTSVRLITTPSEPWTWAGHHHDIAHVTVTFEEAAYGTYTVTTFVKP